MRPVETASTVDRPEPVPVAPRRIRRRHVLVLGVVGVVVLLALALWWFNSAGPAPLTSADVNQAVQSGLEQAKQAERNTPPDATLAYQAITPSLVTITSQGSGGSSRLGSGVIINAEGAVLTALHVVEGSGRIQVALPDGTTTAARIAASQPDNDIAVLAIERLPEVVVPAVMAGPPPVGDAVFAVGNPLGLTRSLSAGVVSATDRSISSEGGPTLKGLIQFDAAVNPGNSGGPLLNRAGHVVGIVTALANPAKQDFFVGIGFAVPIATAGGAAGGPQQ